MKAQMSPWRVKHKMQTTRLSRRWSCLIGALLVAVFFSSPDVSNAKRLSVKEYCLRMPAGPAQSSCLGYYINASSSTDRFCKAMQWRRDDVPSYWCSGINDACLAAELRLSKGKTVVPVCSPLPDGSACASALVAHLKPRCVLGVCRGNIGSPIALPSLPSKPVKSAASLAGSVNIQPLQPLTVKPSATATNLGNASAAVAAKEAMTVDIDTVRLGVAIPHGFLGISLEWPGIEHYGSNIAAWGRALGVLGPAAIIRVGGASQDKLKEVPGNASWEAMAILHKAIGMRFIIGLPLNGNNPHLMTAIMQAARQHLPAAALVGFELGNEPMYWEMCPGVYTGAGGWDESGVYQPGWAPYAAYFDRMARKITGCDSNTAQADNKVLIGPGWDNMNTFPASRGTEILKAAKCYLQDMSVHYYPYYSKHDFNHQSLLAEDLAREASRNATLQVQTAAALGLKLRITEANSLSGSGEAGTSDAFAAALWTADTAFEFAAAGVQSLHFHWGHGGLPGTSAEAGVPVYAGIRTIHLDNGTTAPQTRAPWFGYLLFQAAASPIAAAAAKLGSTTADGQPGRLATITAAAATRACGKGQIKLWPVVHQSRQPGRSELRIVILNKSDTQECYLTLHLNDAYGDAVVTRVMPDAPTGSARMESKRILFGGATYTDRSGLLSRDPTCEVVAADAYTIGTGKLRRTGTSYSLLVPRASAALLVAKDQA